MSHRRLLAEGFRALDAGAPGQSEAALPKLAALAALRAAEPSDAVLPPRCVQVAWGF
jgi:hypothetical protein